MKIAEAKSKYCPINKARCLANNCALWAWSITREWTKVDGAAKDWVASNPGWIATSYRQAYRDLPDDEKSGQCGLIHE